MWAVRLNKLEHLALLAADPRVDLETTDKEGRSLEEVDGMGWKLGLAMRMRNIRMRMKNLIHIIHISIFAKNGNFLGQKWFSLALFSILSAQNIIIAHHT